MVKAIDTASGLRARPGAAEGASAAARELGAITGDCVCTGRKRAVIAGSAVPLPLPLMRGVPGGGARVRPLQRRRVHAHSCARNTTSMITAGPHHRRSLPRLMRRSRPPPKPSCGPRRRNSARGTSGKEVVMRGTGARADLGDQFPGSFELMLFPFPFTS